MQQGNRPQPGEPIDPIWTTPPDETTDEANDSTKSTLRADAVNNAFFAWQLTHESEQSSEQGFLQWPELYHQSKDFSELKRLLKLTCMEYLQYIYDAPISSADMSQLELSIWASVYPPSGSPGGEWPEGAMALPFHDHPLALLSGVFYVQAGGETVAERTPTIFADPRGTPAFRYTGRPVAQQAAGTGPNTRPSDESDVLEPTAPFHRLAYSHAQDGYVITFPSWLVHGVPPHSGSRSRVVLSYNLHTLHGTTLSSWAKVAL